MTSKPTPDRYDPSDSLIDEIRASAPRARGCGVSDERWMIQRAYRIGYGRGEGAGYAAGVRRGPLEDPVASPRRYDVKALLRDPAFRRELIEGAVDFICKVEGIRQ